MGRAGPGVVYLTRHSTVALRGPGPAPIVFGHPSTFPPAPSFPMTSPTASTTPHSTMDIARTLVSLCRAGKNDEAVQTLYAPDIVSVEASGGDETMPREMHGMDAVVAKGKWWMDNHEVHDSTVGGPWPHDDRFIVTFRYDVTNKPSGRRFIMEEAALYTVRDGKIAREEFFYTMDG